MSSGSSKHGCLFYGCLTAVTLVLLGAVVGGFIVWKVRSVALGVTDTAPAAVPVASVDDLEARDIQQRTQDLITSLKENRAGEFRFSERDLNALVATVPDAQGIRGKAAFSIQGDRLVTQTSLPLDQVPGMQGRYLNGKFHLDVKCEGGVLEAYVRDIDVKGDPIPQSIKDRIGKINFGQEIYKDPKAADALRSLESISIRDGKLVIRTGTKR
ncbi:MAG: hypothetical protein A3K19_24190 [Lentisphaerae bacterium RIFOXYB12_FULL_65_16]|nr:MAG: hypothetical protein A3K18_27225 [Lentisphaerae bacterium RIFOXYA12_64_32]OGV87633.1 MAG: hypothetical protein A3K19_24190 [Lentisphaerae bacterium RIFOXYB12_FULL_65_16]